MHNLKEIRKDYSKFEKDLEKRTVKIDFNNLKKLDELNRDLIQKKENLEKEKKRELILEKKLAKKAKQDELKEERKKLLFQKKLIIENEKQEKKNEEKRQKIEAQRIKIEQKKIKDEETKKLRDQMSEGPYIFNLGHGITPDADPKNVEIMLNALRS